MSKRLWILSGIAVAGLAGCAQDQEQKSERPGPREPVPYYYDYGPYYEQRPTPVAVPAGASLTTAPASTQPAGK
jgi:hypothetical protein